MRITFLYEIISGQIDTIYQAALSVGTLLHKKPVATVNTSKQTTSKYNLRVRKPINYSE